jgi:tRNA A37 threonylcarbamoyladenosine biosynthesis protein TsaE
MIPTDVGKIVFHVAWFQVSDNMTNDLMGVERFIATQGVCQLLEWGAYNVYNM